MNRIALTAEKMEIVKKLDTNINNNVSLMNEAKAKLETYSMSLDNATIVKKMVLQDILRENKLTGNWKLTPEYVLEKQEEDVPQDAEPTVEGVVKELPIVEENAISTPATSESL